MEANKVVFSRRAEQRLTELYDYIADNSSSVIAISYIHRIRLACLALEDFPERGVRRDDIRTSLRTIRMERLVTIVAAPRTA